MMARDQLRTVGFLVHDVARLWGKRFDQRARSLGLNRAQCKLLGYLVRNEGINQSGLAELLEVEPITMVRLLDRMEEAGWVERRLDPADRRAYRLYLAEKAKPVFSAIQEVANATSNEAMAGLEATQRDFLLEMLGRIHGNLTELEPILATKAEPAEPAP